ncbi:hypothetical protein LTR28_010737, partial [Elasticomyces elasticus]
EAETHSPILNAIDESDSDDSAIYSDAAEDLSDLEDGGFASLDAIVESPMAPYAPGIPITTPPESPKVAAPANKQAPVTAARSGTHAAAGESGDWGQATAYWSSLSKQRRQQLEREHFSSDDEAKPAPAVVKKPKKKKVKQQTALAAPQQADQPQQTRMQPRKVSTEQEPKPKAPAIRQSMRSTPGHATAENETHMRRSMRSDGMMRTSMRGADNRSPRPSSEYQDRDPPRMKNVRPASAGRPTATKPPTSAVATASLQNQAAQKSVQPGPPPPTRKMFSNDSDSESSFKKRRRPSVSASDAGGKYTMKRSMRSASVDDSRPISPPPASSRGAGKLSLRSMSPTGSFLGRSTMRTSMRASVDSTTPTLRNPDRTRSPPRFGMSAFSKPKPVPAQQPAARAAPAKKMFKSRFADSDSDGDAPASRGGQRAAGAGFRSRFADSDDDSDAGVGRPKMIMPADLTPVRGIPKRRGARDGDSSDLPDSDDEAQQIKGNGGGKKGRAVPSQTDVDRAMDVARRNVAARGLLTQGGAKLTAPSSDAGAALAKGSMRSSAPDDSTNPHAHDSPGGAAQAPKRRGLLGSMLGRRRTSSAVGVPTLASLATSPDPQSRPQRPQSPVARSPRLQRRNTKQMHGADADGGVAMGGLTQQRTTTNAAAAAPTRSSFERTSARPATSDGATEAVRLARSMRPDMGVRGAGQGLGNSVVIEGQLSTV